MGQQAVDECDQLKMPFLRSKNSSSHETDEKLKFLFFSDLKSE